MWKTLKKFYSFILKYPIYFWGSVCIYAISCVFGSIGPVFLKNIVNEVGKGSYNFALSYLVYWIFAEVIGILTYAGGTWLNDYALFPAAKNLRLAVFKHIHTLDFAFHANKASGTLISIFKRGEGAFVTFYTILNNFLVTLVFDVLTMIVVLAGLYPKMVIAWIILFVLNVFVSFFTIKNNITKRQKANKADDVVSATTVDNMIAFDTVMYFANEKYEQERLHKELNIWEKAGINYGMTFRFIDIGNGSIVGLGTVLVVSIALFDLLAGKIGLPLFILTTGFAAQFAPRLFSMVFNFRELAKNYIDLRDYIGILDEKVLIKEQPKVNAMQEWMSELRERKESRIEFENVSFKYEAGRTNVISNISLDIKPGESVALVGKSGAGKTTLVKLLLRFYDPQAGAIRVGGVDIRDVTKEALRKRIGIVPQDTVLFNESLGYNIAYGADSFTYEDIEKACKAANLWGFVQGLPEGLNTLVGERGIKLSGGQRQRLAIARAIMEDAPIIVFDEATSSLDSESEKLIQDAFWKMVEKKTTIIIAHRLSTVKRADRIIVMDEGKIAEEGTHRQLLNNKNGIYSKLWDLQTKSNEEYDPDLTIATNDSL